MDRESGAAAPFAGAPKTRAEVASEVASFANALANAASEVASFAKALASAASEVAGLAKALASAASEVAGLAKALAKLAKALPKGGIAFAPFATAFLSAAKPPALASRTMGESSSKLRRGQLRVAAGGIGLAGGWAFLVFGGTWVQRLADAVHDWWWKGHGEWITASVGHRFVDLLGHMFLPVFVVGTIVGALVGASVVVPVGFLARLVARARIRAGHADLLERPRAWAREHPLAVRRITAAIAAAWTVLAAARPYRLWSFIITQGQERLIFSACAFVGVLSFVVSTWVLRAGVRVLLAPTMDDSEPATTSVGSDEITFDAVAVTRETIAAIGAMALLPLWAVAYALLSDSHGGDATALTGMAVQAVVAIGGAMYFRHASKVAVGVDGVFVSGTARTRFFAYRDLDGARALRNGDIVLSRGKRTVLRLQLHGADASKRDAVLARILEAIDRVKSGHSAVAAQLVSAASADKLVSAASGGGDYRGAALTREQLWALVEGPEIEESARRAAAVALAKTGDESERVRLRVAAEHCAAPQVRVALLELAAISGAEVSDAAPGQAEHRVVR